MSTFTITDPGLDPTWLICVLLAGVGLLLVGLAMFSRPKGSDAWENLAGFFILLGVGGGIVGGGFAGSMMTQVHSADIHEQQVAGIESLGYDNVDLGRTFFTAADADGKYVHGVLVDLGEDTYTVLETKEP